MARPLTQAIMLLIAFTVLPEPTGPTWKTFGPMALRTGLALASGSASPPTMMARVAARAPVTPPLTGASRKNTPRAFALGSIFRGVEGSTLLRSMRMVPGLARSTRPPASRYTASTSGDAGSEVNTTSEPSTTSWAERARRAPACIRFSMALGFMSKTSMGKPAFRTFPAMRLPMFPTPMKPTDRAIARLLDPDGEVGRLRGRGSIAPDGAVQTGSSERPARRVCRLRRPDSYFLPIVTLLPAPLTVTSAVLGEPRWTEPRLGFWMAPAPIDTFEAVAPLRSATGMPPIIAQDPPQ